MAEPTDYFLQGANLGMRAMQAGAEMHKFRTNLAERARQFNEGLDLQRNQVDAAIARDNAYVKKLEFDLKAQSDAFNRETIELQKLDEYSAQLQREFEENVPNLSLPPSGLTGQRYEQAISMREGAFTTQQRSMEYQAISQDRADEMDLIRNYGLPANWKEYSEDGLNIMQESRNRRNKMEADQIASKYGTTARQIAQAYPELQGMNLTDYKGNLNKSLWEGIVQQVTGRTQTSRSVSPSGASQYSISSNRTDRKPSYLEIVKQATELATITDEQSEGEFVDEGLRERWIQHLQNPDQFPAPKRSSSTDPEFQKIEDIINASRR